MTMTFTRKKRQDQEHIGAQGRVKAWKNRRKPTESAKDEGEFTNSVKSEMASGWR
jgi:hypothetical protein